MIFVGDDWAEDHHDVFVCGADGVRLARRRLGEGVDGIAAFPRWSLSTPGIPLMSWWASRPTAACG